MAAASVAASGACSCSARSATRAELLRRVGLEQVRAAVDRVHRLAQRGVAWKLLRDADVAFVERVEKRAQRVFRNRRVCHGAEV